MCLQPNAQEEAENEVRKLGELQEEEKRKRREQLEKARHRGMEAMRRKHLTEVSICRNCCEHFLRKWGTLNSIRGVSKQSASLDPL